MELYIDIDDNGRIISSDSNDTGNVIRVEIEDQKILEGTNILSCYYIDGKVVLDEEAQEQSIRDGQKAKLIEEATVRLKEFETRNLLRSLTDEEAYSVSVLYPEWSDKSISYHKDERLIFNDKFYKVLLDHTSQADWTPDVSVSLFVEISDPSIEYPEWKRPTGSHDSYRTGDKITFNNKKYISLVDNNIYSPEEYPANWKEVI